jgi:hypothetical protein
MHERIWERVEDLVDRAAGVEDLREHRLELIAARRWRALGRSVPPEIVHEERLMAIITMTAPLLLEKIRDAVDGPILLLKGPELAARYPDPALRPYGDIDILVPDARIVHQALQAAGFEEVGDPALFVDLHHLRPLILRPFPMPVEVHAAPKWIEKLEPPPLEELIAAAVPSLVDVDGLSTLRADHHALVLAAHSWAHEPLRRILDLLDIAVLLDGVDRAELRQLARHWQIERVWKTTLAVTETILGENRTRAPAPLRLWARNVRGVRRRTVLENHLARWLAGFWALPPRKAFRAAAESAAQTVAPQEGETWSEKLARTTLAVRHAATARREHERVLSDRRRRRV